MRRLLGWAALGMVLMVARPGMAAEPGLVAHYSFDEGSGTVLRDLSGNGNDGEIRGASWVKRAEGYCLEFNGVDQFVDCGSKPSLDLQEKLSLEAWVYPKTAVKNEPAIMGKHFNSYLLSYYSDGQCWWYISGGGNNCSTPLAVGAWRHVVGTFDGQTLKLYVDGKLASTKPSAAAKINAGKSFFIGCVSVSPEVTAPAPANANFFPGMIDEVRVYNRVLADTEIAERFRTGQKE